LLTVMGIFTYFESYTSWYAGLARWKSSTE
jgi:hypothetical protein